MSLIPDNGYAPTVENIAKEVRLSAPYRGREELEALMVALSTKAAPTSEVYEEALLPIWFLDDSTLENIKPVQAGYVQTNFKDFVTSVNGAEHTPLTVELLPKDSGELLNVPAANCYLSLPLAEAAVKTHLTYWLKEASRELEEATRSVKRNSYSVETSANGKTAYREILAIAKKQQQQWQKAVVSMMKALCNLG